MSPAAVIVDQVELFRLGVEQVLTDVDVPVISSSSLAGDGLRIARAEAADLIIVGRVTDLKTKNILRAVKGSNNPLKVMFLLDKAGLADVARLISDGADGLMLRTAKASELRDGLLRMMEGERVVASALAVGTVGRVGPSVDISQEEAIERSGLSPKELEVLGELASGLTYKEIAEALIVTQATVKTHLVHIYAKLGVKNRHEAVTRALALGLLA